jgi:acyl carrier protein
MTLDEMMDDFRGFVKKEFNVGDNDPDFNNDVHLFDYGYVDSFGAVSLINYIQKRFGVTISDQDLVVHPLNTVREICTLVHQRMGNR